MIRDNAWETLLHHAALLPKEEKDETFLIITKWKRIEARPLPSVRKHGWLQMLKRRREEGEGSIK